jgi:hypothetical protein
MDRPAFRYTYSREVTLVGVDCATQAGKTGLAFGTFKDGQLTVTGAFTCGTDGRSVCEQIVSEVSAYPAGPTLLALDAPLGWPQELAIALADHRAGDEITVDSSLMFCRQTDRFIQQQLKKKPLEVGADRIARTAHAALRLLADVGRSLGGTIPLAWEVPLLHPISAIEVYPAATLIGHGIEAKGYKQAGGTARRQALVHSLARLATLPTDTTTLVANADALDAVICLLAGADFLRGAAMPPADFAAARREGWIWARKAPVESAR